MLQRAKILVVIAACIIAVTIVASGQAWPKTEGVYVARSSKAIPAFPRNLSQYRFAGLNKDYWGEMFQSSGTIRVFEGNNWKKSTNFHIQ